MTQQEASQTSAVDGCEIAGTVSPGQTQESDSSPHGENGGVFSAPETFLLVDDNKINLQVRIPFLYQPKAAFS